MKAARGMVDPVVAAAFNAATDNLPTANDANDGLGTRVFTGT